MLLDLQLIEKFSMWGFWEGIEGKNMFILRLSDVGNKLNYGFIFSHLMCICKCVDSYKIYEKKMQEDSLISLALDKNKLR